MMRGQTVFHKIVSLVENAFPSRLEIGLGVRGLGSSRNVCISMALHYFCMTVPLMIPAAAAPLSAAGKRVGGCGCLSSLRQAC